MLLALGHRQLAVVLRGIAVEVVVEAVDDRTFVHTMQQVNLAIVNPVFLATFLGAPALAATLREHMDEALLYRDLARLEVLLTESLTH